MSNWTSAEMLTVISAFGALMTLVGKTVMDVISTARAAKAIAQVKDDLAENTKITKAGAEEATGHAKQAADTAEATSQKADDIKVQLNGSLDKKIASALEGHDLRITALEGQMTAVKMAIDGVSKDVSSFRHEMRGHFQTLITNQVAAMVKPSSDH